MSKRAVQTSEKIAAKDAILNDPAWDAKLEDFADVDALAVFLKRRESFLNALDAAGLQHQYLVSFEPNKPGFNERVIKAFDSLEKSMKARAAE